MNEGCRVEETMSRKILQRIIIEFKILSLLLSSLQILKEFFNL